MFRKMRAATEEELRFDRSQFSNLDPDYTGWARERFPNDDGVRHITRRVTKWVAEGARSSATVRFDEIEGVDNQ